MRLLNETKEIPIGESTFKIGIIDRRRFHGIRVRYFAPTKFLTKLNPEELKGLSPAEIGLKAEEGMTQDQVQKNEEIFFSAQWDLVKFGVKGHSIKDDAGNEIPLIKDDGGCVADQTIEFYDLNKFFSKVANEVFIFNTMSEDQKKNS